MPPRKTSGRRISAARAASRVRIRMYRHGLGDCFLLTFHGRVHVLIDCGVIVGTQNPEPLMTRVAEDIRTVTGGTVDVLVVTHEHWDHVSGFKQARDVFKGLKFREVWMAWTEDPGNALANQLRQERKAKLTAAVAAHARLTSSSSAALNLMARGVGEVLGFAGVGLGADAASGGDTAEAMKWARERGAEPGSRLQLLEPGKAPFPLPGAEGVRVYVLGPPQDEKLIHRSDPSKAHSEVYLTPSTAFTVAAAERGSDAAAVEASMPFAPERRVVAPKGQPGAGASTDLRDVMRRYLAPDEAYRSIEDDWLSSAGSLALKLDSDTNNTSLVLAFEFADSPEREVLLFPGDAQVGNWLSWDRYEWTVKDSDGSERKVNAGDLLARTVFYKVGHHGSHNATLKAGGLERMTSRDLVAMVPVNQAMARKKKWSMPWPELRRRLDEKCSSLIVQDEGAPQKAPRRGKVSVHEPAKAGEASLYVDYEF